MDTPQSAAVAFLSARNIPYRVFVHSGQVDSLEQAAAERGQTPGQIIRSLLFRLPDARYCLVLVAGPDQLDWKSLRRHLNTKHITMARPEEVFEATGYRIGSVSPFGLPHPLPILVATRIKELREISLGSGLPGVGIIMNAQDMISALDEYEWIEV